MEIIHFIFTCIVCVQMVYLSTIIIRNLKSPVKNAGKDTDTPQVFSPPEGIGSGGFRSVPPASPEGRSLVVLEICSLRERDNVYVSAEYVCGVYIDYEQRQLTVYTADGASRKFDAVYDYRFLPEKAVNPKAMARSFFSDSPHFRTAPLF